MASVRELIGQLIGLAVLTIRLGRQYGVPPDLVDRRHAMKPTALSSEARKRA
jgi:hypothetical protein